MKTFIASAVFTGILLLIPASPVLAASMTTTPAASATVTALNSRDVMIEGASESATVQLHFAGAEHIDFGLGGELLITRHGSREHYRAEAYQKINGKTKYVTVSYERNGADMVTVKFGKFDPSAPIIMRGGGATL